MGEEHKHKFPNYGWWRDSTQLGTCAECGADPRDYHASLEAENRKLQDLCGRLAADLKFYHGPAKCGFRINKCSKCALLAEADSLRGKGGS